MVTFLLACSGLDGFEELREGELGSLPYAAEHFEAIWPGEGQALVRPAPGHPMGDEQDALVLADCDWEGEVRIDGAPAELPWAVVERYEDRCLWAAPVGRGESVALGDREGRILRDPVRRLVHLSDLHQQGCQPDPALLAVIEAVNGEEADLVLVSGDLVDNGPRPCQWAAVREALEGLGAPVLVVPGNHDYEHGSEDGDDDPHAGLALFMGTFHPLLAPRLELDGLGVLGLDTGTSTSSTSWTSLKLITTRGLTTGQVDDVRAWLDTPGPRVLVGHAPFRTSALGLGERGHKERSGAMEDSAGLEAVLADSPALALFGHTHVNESWRAEGSVFRREELPQPPTGGESDPEPLEGAWMVTTQSATRPWPRDGSNDRRGEGQGYRVLEHDGQLWWSRSVRLELPD